MKVRLLIVGLTLLAGCSQQAAVEQLGHSPDLQSYAETLRAITVVDLDAATARAERGGDKLGAMCYPVLKTYVQKGPQGIDQIAGNFDGFEKLRLQRKQVEGMQMPEDLRIACAPLFMDERDFALRMAAIAGSRGTLRLP
jgi:hypothetical protein